MDRSWRNRDRAAWAEQLQAGPKEKSPFFCLLMGQNLGHPARKRGTLLRSQGAEMTMLSLCVQPLVTCFVSCLQVRKGSSLELKDWDHGPSAVHSVWPSAARVSRLLPDLLGVGDLAGIFLKLTSWDPRVLVALLPSLPLLCRWLLLATVTVGLLAQSVLGVSTARTPRAWRSAPVTGWDARGASRKISSPSPPECACVL